MKVLDLFKERPCLLRWNSGSYAKTSTTEFCKTAATATTLSIESTMGRTFHRVMAAFFYMVKRVAVTTFTSFLPQKVRRRGKKQEAEDDQTLGKGGNTGTQHPETGPAEYRPPTNKILTTSWWESDCGSPELWLRPDKAIVTIWWNLSSSLMELKFQPYGTGWNWTLWLNMTPVQLI